MFHKWKYKCVKSKKTPTHQQLFAWGTVAMVTDAKVGKIAISLYLETVWNFLSTNEN